MKVASIICLLVVGLLAVSPLGGVLAQEEEEEPIPVLISEPDYTLNFTPSQGRHDAKIVADDDRTIYLELENTGTATVNNIAFSSEEPDDWDVEFDPEKVTTLETEETERVGATIEVPANASAGDYMVTLTASGDEVSAKAVDIRVTVTVTVKEPIIEIRALYPTLEGIAGEDFVFEVEFQHIGASMMGEPVIFNLLTTAPPDWEVHMTPPYEKEKKLSAINLKPGFTFTDKTRVVVKPLFWPLPEPGEYKITLTADSGELKDTVELTARITARYALVLLPSAERYNTTATSGKDNYFEVTAGNLGTAAIGDIKLSADKPEGWTIEFSPEKLDSLEAINTQKIDVNIKPPPETIAGDYSINLKASGTQTTARDLNIRVTVESPTIWGWVGVIIIVLVVAGLVVVFLRFSRR